VKVHRPRWRCALCIAFGFAATADEAERDFYAHYMTMHRQESK
jgi:hypothetical protein